MDRTECTLMDAAKKIEKDFLLIGLPVTLEDFLTSEEYETLRFASEGFLPDNCEENWNTINRIYQKVDKLAADAPGMKLHAMSELIRKESLNSKPKFIGFEAFDFDKLIEKVNKFINSDECKEFIDFDFKTTQQQPTINGSIVYSGLVKYRASASDEDDSQKRRDAVKEFASEVRTVIEDTYQKFGGSSGNVFTYHGLDLIEAVQNKLDEVLKQKCPAFCRT